jgi:LmbE family N-acetylglucosaminyl deacetylase
MGDLSGVSDSSRFTVDRNHLGHTETDWAASPKLARVPPLELHSFDEVLVVAPHPDDEILGAAGLLQLVVTLAPVEVYAVTDGEGSHPTFPAEDLRRLRNRESSMALERLGLAGISRTRLRYPDGLVSQHEDKLEAVLADRLGPASLCVAPWRGDGHPDHDTCGRAAGHAAAATGAQLLEYPVWAWHWADPLGEDLPWARCRRLHMDRRRAARKRWATTAYVSQIRPFGPGALELAILPPPVLRRFWRSFEVYIT